MMNANVEMRMDLKICERCGALWLRVIGGEARHCGRCLRALAEGPERVELRKGRPEGQGLGSRG